MRCLRNVIGSVVTLLLVFAADGWTGTQEETHTYKGLEVIRITTISGDCVIEKSPDSQVTVEVVWSYHPRDSFEPRFSERGKVLKLSEEMHDSNSGSSTWTVAVPDGVEVSFNSASGGMVVTGLNGRFSCETASGSVRVDDSRGEFRFSSASGNIELRDCSGTFELSSASGDVELKDCTGDFEASSASGDVDAELVSLDDVSSFSAASGSVNVVLAKSAAYDLEVSSASGDAVLNYGGNQVVGYFEFTAMYRHGHIDAPFDFEDEEEFEHHGERYMRKWFTQGSDKPRILVSTGSGTVRLEKS